MKKIFYLLILFIANASAHECEIDLAGYEKKLYSAHGEDGIIARIFQLIEAKSRYVVDIGAGDGITKSCTYLLRLQKWNCALFDRTHEKLPFKLYKEFITKENINEIFKKYNVQKEIDLFCIDHFNEFYLWHELKSEYCPRVVMIKYNASYPPDADLVAKYRPYYIGDDTNYFGASILALYNLARQKGYSLVYAESIGMNLFFIRDEVLKEHHLIFKNMNDVSKIYRFPAYANGPLGGFRQDPKKREYLNSSKILDEQ